MTILVYNLYTAAWYVSMGQHITERQRNPMMQAGGLAVGTQLSKKTSHRKLLAMHTMKVKVVVIIIATEIFQWKKMLLTAANTNECDVSFPSYHIT